MSAEATAAIGANAQGSPGEWETFTEGPCIGVRGHGATPAEAFSAAASALMSVIVDPDTVKPTLAVPIACAAPDQELLLLAWLNELIGTMSRQERLFSRFDVRVGDGRITGTAYGEPVDPARHKLLAQVRSAKTDHLRVACDHDGRWRAQCVLDA